MPGFVNGYYGHIVIRWWENSVGSARNVLPVKGLSGSVRDREEQFNLGVLLERVALDILGLLPTSVRGKKNIVIVGDYFTKWVE